MKTGTVEALIGIDITYPRHTALIQQERFKLAAMPRHESGKHREIERQGIRPQPANDTCRILDQPDPAKLARIVKTQRHAIIQHQHQPRMPLNRLVMRHQKQAAGHAQVHNQYASFIPGTLQVKEQIFSIPCDGPETTPLKQCIIKAAVSIRYNTIPDNINRSDLQSDQARGTIPKGTNNTLDLR